MMRSSLCEQGRSLSSFKPRSAEMTHAPLLEHRDYFESRHGDEAFARQIFNEPEGGAAADAVEFLTTSLGVSTI